MFLNITVLLNQGGLTPRAKITVTGDEVDQKIEILKFNQTAQLS